MKRLNLVLLVVIIVGGFIFRLYRFDNPIADWHSWRQADTSAVSRNFVNNGFDILHPRFDDLSNVPSGFDNPEGLRFVEFPIYNIFQAGLFKLIGILTLEEWGRLVTIFSSLSTAILIYLLLKKYQNEVAALMGAFFFTFLPYDIFFGRTILPDTTTAAAILAGIYFFDLWIDNASQKKLSLSYILPFVLSIIFTASAFLLKPFAIFFTLPMVYLAFNKFGSKAFINPLLWTFAILTVLPLGGWRMWMNQYPEGIPVSAWLLNGGNIRFKGSFFYWIFAERIGRLILGYWGIVLLVLGLISKVRKESLFIYAFLVSVLLYITIIARGNVQHDYYQILIMPSICIFLGLGGEFLLSSKSLANKFVGPIALLAVSVFTFLFSWYYVRDYFNINNQSIVVAGAAVDRLTPGNAKVIANYNGDTSFLYQTKRKGWASYEKDLPGMISLGADYLVLANPVPSDFVFASEYLIVEQTQQYAIFDLRRSP